MNLRPKARLFRCVIVEMLSELKVSKDINKSLDHIMPGPVARSDARLSGMRTVAGSIFGSIVEIGHEIISTAILSLPLIPVGQ